VKLTVVGCSGSLPGPDSPASCYLVEAMHDGAIFRLVLDLGSGALGPLQRYVPLEGIGAVLLSHLHADHVLDMCGYYVARKYSPHRGGAPIPVHGPAGTAARLARAYDLPESPGMTGQFAFSPLCAASALELGPFRVTVARVEHPGEAYAVRVEHDGRAIVYSGDTAPCDALVELARDADLFLCEASFQEGRDTAPGLHLNGRQAGEHAARAGVRLLVLTHVPPWNDPMRAVAEAAATYDGPIQLARAGATYEL
jgi:ribonuclease BN (tRNA processing enzyme)